MARVTFVKKAQKAQGECQRCRKKIKVGDSYFWFANRIGRSSRRKNFCAEHRPKQSEITTSDKLSTLYAAQEDGEAAINSAESFEDIAAALREAGESARSVAEEYRDSIQNMPENFQQGSQADEMEEKAFNCEEWADALDSAADEIGGMTETEPEADSECANCQHTFSEHSEGGACSGKDEVEGATEAEPCDCKEFESADDQLEDARSQASDAIGELQL